MKVQPYAFLTLEEYTLLQLTPDLFRGVAEHFKVPLKNHSLLNAARAIIKERHKMSDLQILLEEIEALQGVISNAIYMAKKEGNIAKLLVVYNALDEALNEIV